MTTKRLCSVLNKYVFMFALVVMSLCHNFANASTPFEYNIIPETKSNSIVDTKATKFLAFSLYENQNDIYYKGNLVKVKDKSFKVDVSKLSGKTKIVFNDSNGNESSFTYNFSDKKGKLEDYTLVDGKKLNVYVTTSKNIQIIYTDKEKSSVSKIKSYINKMPSNVTSNLKQIKMIPYSNTQNIAGSTKDSVVTLYNFSKYDSTTQKNIIFHEITHTWANKLMEKAKIDYDYTKYNEVVKKDGNFVSNYAEKFANNNGRLSEDFADSVAFYLINQKSFAKKYPNRTTYIKELMKA